MNSNSHLFCGFRWTTGLVIKESGTRETRKERKRKPTYTRQKLQLTVCNKLQLQTQWTFPVFYQCRLAEMILILHLISKKTTIKISSSFYLFETLLVSFTPVEYKVIKLSTQAILKPCFVYTNCLYFVEFPCCLT